MYDHMYSFVFYLIEIMKLSIFSSVSSGLNALSAVILIDMVKPVYKYKTGKDLEEKVATFVSKGLGIYMQLYSISIKD